MTPAFVRQRNDIGDPSVMDAGAVAAALGVDVETGLSAQEAASRLAQSGPHAAWSMTSVLENHVLDAYEHCCDPTYCSILL